MELIEIPLTKVHKFYPENFNDLQIAKWTKEIYGLRVTFVMLM
jgi:hypothetical protein